MPAVRRVRAPAPAPLGASSRPPETQLCSAPSEPPSLVPAGWESDRRRRSGTVETVSVARPLSLRAVRGSPRARSLRLGAACRCGRGCARTWGPPVPRGASRPRPSGASSGRAAAVRPGRTLGQGHSPACPRAADRFLSCALQVSGACPCPQLTRSGETDGRPGEQVLTPPARRCASCHHRPPRI